MERRAKRRPELAALNVLLCLLVIFIHVTSAPVTGYVKSSVNYALVFFPWRFAGFVVPGFIFLSGLRLFLTKSGGINYGSFYIGRLKRIVLPYIAWNVVFYLYFIFKHYFPFSLPDLASKILTGDLVSPFYFIVVIVQFYALAPLWFLIVRKANLPAALLISAAVTFLCSQYLPMIISNLFHGANFQYNDRVLTTYLFYWIAGCFVGAEYDRACRWFLEKRHLFLAFFALFCLLDEALTYISFSGIHYLRWLDRIHFFYCVFAVFFFFTLFVKLYLQRDMTNTLAKKIDGAAYPIFLSHCLVIFIVNDFMKLAGITSITVAYAIRIAAVYSVTITLCILWKQIAAKLSQHPISAVLH